MKRLIKADTCATGLAIFAMFFGAGNLIFPLRSGLMAGQHYTWAALGFLITGICFPFMGLIASILFDGDYERFFNRLGTIAGSLLLLFCMLVIGPMIAMPRITTLSYVMIEPFLPEIPLFLFSILFLLLTFFATYRESKILDLLGYVISPLKFLSLMIIIVVGLMTGTTTTESSLTSLQSFIYAFIDGYKTLDVLGGIVFGSIILTLLKRRSHDRGEQTSNKQLAAEAFHAGLIGITILGCIYCCMVYLGAYFGRGFESANEGELFSAISFAILGKRGAAVIAIAVLMACYSTIIALTAVFSEYLEKTICQNRISYLNALLLTLGATLVTSNFGLTKILQFSGPLIDIIYPSLIVLTALNIGYALFNFKPVKLLVFATLITSIAHYFFYVG
jgi:branched-chain amino acid:cation transporter, LIVCS family